MVIAFLPLRQASACHLPLAGEDKRVAWPAFLVFHKSAETGCSTQFSF
jgi:hypothetical protein